MFDPGTFLRCTKRLILWPMIMLKSSDPEDKTRIIHYHYLFPDDVVMFLRLTPESTETHRSMIVLHPDLGVQILIDFQSTLDVI